MLDYLVIVLAFAIVCGATLLFMKVTGKPRRKRTKVRRRRGLCADVNPSLDPFRQSLSSLRRLR